MMKQTSEAKKKRDRVLKDYRKSDDHTREAQVNAKFETAQSNYTEQKVTKMVDLLDGCMDRINEACDKQLKKNKKKVAPNSQDKQLMLMKYEVETGAMKPTQSYFSRLKTYNNNIKFKN